MELSYEDLLQKTKTSHQLSYISSNLCKFLKFFKIQKSSNRINRIINYYQPLAIVIENQEKHGLKEFYNKIAE